MKNVFKFVVVGSAIALITGCASQAELQRTNAKLDVMTNALTQQIQIQNNMSNQLKTQADLQVQQVNVQSQILANLNAKK